MRKSQPQSQEKKKRQRQLLQKRRRAKGKRRAHPKGSPGGQHGDVEEEKAGEREGDGEWERKKEIISSTISTLGQGTLAQ